MSATSKPAAAETKTPASKPGRQTVTLKKPHNHASVQYDTGKTIEVSPQIADWLRQRGVI